MYSWRMLDMGRLRLLRAVVATGSVRASATALGYTPSAVSQQLATLQRETRLQLFNRAGRGIEPTEAARTLAAESEPLFQELNRIEGVVDDLRAGRIGSLSIGYFGSAGAAWLPAIVAALSAGFPELRLDLRVTEGREPGAPEPDIDIVVERPNTQPAAHQEMRHLIDDPYVAVVATCDPLARRASVALADLASRLWVDNDLAHGPCRQVLLTACAEAGFAPRFAVETHDYRTAMAVAATGVGITVIPELGTGELPEGLHAVRIVDPTPVRRIGVAVKKSVADHPAARRVLEVLQSRLDLPAQASA